jgi:hypothetical protein
MKMKVVALIAIWLLTGAIWAYSQMMGPQDMYGCPWMSSSEVQSMRRHPMMG